MSFSTVLLIHLLHLRDFPAGVASAALPFSCYIRTSQHIPLLPNSLSSPYIRHLVLFTSRITLSSLPPPTPFSFFSLHFFLLMISVTSSVVFNISLEASPPLQACLSSIICLSESSQGFPSPRQGKKNIFVILPCQRNVGSLTLCVCVCLLQGYFHHQVPFPVQTLLPGGLQTKVCVCVCVCHM